jgi:acetylglutamate kinase
VAGARARTTAALRPVVLKLGGELLENAVRAQTVGGAIAGLQCGPPLVVVHGGGRDIDAALARAGLVTQQVDGLRITDAATLDVVVAVLAGLVNTRLVAAVTAAGGGGIGLTGADDGIGLVEKAPPHAATDGRLVDLGRVGQPVEGRPPQVLVTLCRAGFIPIVASIGVSPSGELYNVNADTLAAHLAGSLHAVRLVVAGGTAGVLDADGHTIASLDTAGIDRLIESGTATAGMVAKLTACRVAIAGGVGEVFIADGRDLAGVTELVRRGAQAGVAGCTRITRTGQPRRTATAPESGRRAASRRAPVSSTTSRRGSRVRS